MRRLHRIGLIPLLVLLVPTPAGAYIDPLSGSVLLQVLAAGLLAALYMMKNFWRRMISMTRRVVMRIFGR